MPPSLAKRIEGLRNESAFEVLSRARALEVQGRRILHLEIGQPDFPTPEHIVEAAFRAVREGKTGYGPTLGVPELREAVAQYTYQTRGVSVSADRVAITPGAKPMLLFTVLALVEPGDEVIYPDPGFPIYASVIRMAGGKPVPLPLREALGFRFEVAELAERVSPRTKLVILNSPQNPTGGVLGHQELEAIAELAERHDFYVLSDEVYSRLVYDTTAPSIAQLPGMLARTVLVDGVSKAYSMTGWRLGWGVLPEELVPAIELLMVNSNSCTATFIQYAAVAALQGPQDCVAAMRAEFHRRRDRFVDGLNRIPGIRCEKPQGAFYAFPNTAQLDPDDRRLAGRLLEEAGIAALWGSSFGRYGTGYLRFSYATAMEVLEESLERLTAFVGG